MLKPFMTLMRLSVMASCLLPLGVWAHMLASSFWKSPDAMTWPNLARQLTLLILITAATIYALIKLPRWLDTHLQTLSENQTQYLQQFKPRLTDLAIFTTAALSLLLELAVIRWQSSLFVLFAFYKNFSLLACFLGLGLGYALSDRKHIPLMLVIPLMAWQALILSFTKFGPTGWSCKILSFTPIAEQLNMGTAVDTKTYQYLAVYAFLAVVFVMTALIFIPVGQLCGALMNRRPKLRAYGLNLLGSIVGVAIIFLFSLFWTPPLVWFVPVFALLIAFQAYSPKVLVSSICALALLVVVLAWPTTPFWEQIHSPYQLLERGYSNNDVTVVRAAGHYYQRIHDYSHLEKNGPRDHVAQYYELPFGVFGPADRIAIVGSGTGNDVAAALRCDVNHIDAIEIDPGIIMIGQRYHPEKPYDNPRVNPIINDARSFLRNTEQTYDMVVYGLLDSHTLLSHASNVRVDSFVYTVEALREARARLKPNGMLSLSFAILKPELGRKIYMMITEAFNGAEPVCLEAQKDGAVVYFVRKTGSVEIPQHLLDSGAFTDATSLYADPSLQADVSTDDWPFFYMPRRVYPISYLIIIGIILILSVITVLPFFRGRSGSPWQSSHAVFFLLGAGFMLIETKGITELGLTFGNTWQVIGILLGGILTMAFIANCVVVWLGIRRIVIPFILLLAALALGLWIARSGGFSSTTTGRLATLLVLTCPCFLAASVFHPCSADSMPTSPAPWPPISSAPWSAASSNTTQCTSASSGSTGWLWPYTAWPSYSLCSPDPPPLSQPDQFDLLAGAL